MPKSPHGTEQRALQGVLRSLRCDNGLTQKQLADRLKLPQSYVSKYENGERRLDLIELKDVCAALSIDLQLLVKQFEEALRDS